MATGNAPNLGKLTTLELLRLQAQAVEQLVQQEIVRTRNNPVADYAEHLVAKAYGWQLEANSKAGYDILGDGDRYQVKSRRVTAANKSRQLGVIRKYDEKPFDWLIAVIFNEDFTVQQAIKLPHAAIRERSKFNDAVNGRILHLKGKILTHPDLIDITDDIKAAQLEH